MPLEARAQPAGGWSQATGDAANTSQAVAHGPADPGLKWAIDLESIVTDQAPHGYVGGGQGAVHRPILGPDGRLIVPVANPDEGRPAFVALDPGTGEIARELQRRAAACAPAFDSQGRIWAGMNFDCDDRTTTNSQRAFDADGRELEGSMFDLDDLDVSGRRYRWCGIQTALHIGGHGADERLVLFHVGDANADLAALDISGDTPTVAW